MSLEFNAKYYAGVKPQAASAKVIAEQKQIRIMFSKDNMEKECIWQIEQIKLYNQDEDKMILKYGVVHPFEFLEFEGTETIQQMKNAYPGIKWKTSSNFISRNPMLSIIIAGAGMILFGMMAYFFLVPKIANQLANKVPLKWEIEMGNKLSKGMIADNREDKIKSRMLDTFFIMMDVQGIYPIHFHFINDSIINAFAMPGGNIVIYKGLFDKIKTYESLCGLIGHEFTHIKSKHSLKTIFRSVSAYIILAAFFGDLTGLAGVIVENANSIQNLSYSREFEREADANAVNLLLERKIGLTGMLDLFKIFLSDENKGLAIPKFLSTHPVTEDRIQFIKSKMSQKEKDLVHYQNLLELFNRLKDRK